ncbi:hypothetical protein LCGC14_1903040 [marine sediment metagenome]|uniref:Uncharacterized protein n=1 Tax=marine sediment metagenome TaxID=412755 RepID=A0A0F9GJ91_9ZZZZ
MTYSHSQERLTRHATLKKALIKEFGKIVTVHGDRGTAYGWANIKINKVAEEGDAERAREIVEGLWKELGGGYYTVDDGYNSQSAEFIIQFNFA